MHRNRNPSNSSSLLMVKNGSRARAPNDDVGQHGGLTTLNLVPRAHVSFGQHQDTELWNNQLLFLKKQKTRGLWERDCWLFQRSVFSVFLLVSSVLTKRHVGTGKETAVRVLFFEHTHRISFVLSAKQICQTWLWAKNPGKSPGNQPTDQAD